MTVTDRPSTERELTPTELPAAEKAQQWAESQLVKMQARSDQRLMDLTADRAARGAATNGAVALGQPIVNDYVAFDVACTSPIQFEGLPPYRPGKVIAGGEEAFIVAFLWVNPVVSVIDGFAVPPTVQLAGRRFRVALHELNITEATVGTNVVNPQQQATFGTPAASLTAFVFTIRPPDPGPNPKLFEANVTVDVDRFAQPYAAFATNFFDVDDDPGFLFVPSSQAGFRHLLPNRYLVYSE
jgi:hypothetical protein